MNIEYLKTEVGRHLCLALTEVARRRPDRPIEFLAYYLISLHEKELKEQQERDKAAVQTRPKSSTRLGSVNTVEAVVSEIVEETSRLYCPEVRKSDVSIDDILLTEIKSDREQVSRRLSSILIGTDAQYDEMILERLSTPEVRQSVSKADSIAPNVFVLNDQGESDGTGAEGGTS